MKVSKTQIINGFVDYVESEIIPKMNDDRSMQIIISVGLNMVKSNSKATDAIFTQPMVSALLSPDEEGMFEIDGLFDTLKESVEKYGYFPIVINPIPIISPTEKELKFTAEDITEIKKHIERSR